MGSNVVEEEEGGFVNILVPSFSLSTYVVVTNM